MRSRRNFLACLALCAAAGTLRAAEDPVLRAMRDEMARSRALRIVNLDTPYYIAYALDEADMFSASATLGGLLFSERRRFLLPDIDVRVGDYKFDNTNYVGSGFLYAGRYGVDRFPLDHDYGVLRRYLWLATDQAYKSAVEAIARKRAALKNATVSEQIPDFAKVQPVKRVLDSRAETMQESAWVAQLKALSAVFAAYPQLRSSSVDFQATQGIRYMLTSEGTEIRLPQKLIFIRARVTAQAADGMTVRDAAVFHSLDFTRLAPQSDLERSMRQLAENAVALAAAPAGESYAGPVLFEGEAAAQLFAEVLGRNLALPRRPVMEPGRGGVFLSSELEGRAGARVLPEWMDVVDDPTQSEWRGRQLLGRYEVDLEGVVPEPLVLVDKGILKNYLLTRQPVRGFEASNGRARMPGSFGARTAGISNLFVRAAQTAAAADLRRRLLEMCQARNKPYGLIVRKMDFPSSASFEEVRRVLAGMAQSGGAARPASLPLLVYRVYPDGKEDLVRGLRFRGLGTRSLRDIVAASDESHLFEFLDNPAPFALMGAGGYVSESAVVAPSVLIDDVELQKIDDQQPRPPLVPPPLK